jgi:PleD family two-component response regulator
MIDPRGMPRTPLVLVVDDQEWTARSIESILGSSGCAVLKAYTGRQALDLAAKIRPDAVIIDMHLPDMTGPDVCRAMREMPTVGRGTPLLVLTTAPLGRSERLTAVESGAWDILRPPFDPEELLMKISTFVMAKLEADQAREESLCDPVTGVYNVKGILRRVDEITADAARSQRPLACVVVGVEPGAPDGSVSERASRQDAIARTMARVIGQTTRLSDTLGRLGHTDFVVVTAGTDQKGADRIADRILEALAASGEFDAGLPLRTGVYSVADLRADPVIPVDLLTKATMALRRSQWRPGGTPLEN